MAIFRNRATQVSALALVLLLFLVWFPSTQTARQIAFDRLRNSLRQRDVLIEGGRLDYNLLGLTATLTNVTFRAAHVNGLAPIATVQTAHIGFNWRTLSALTLDIDSANISGLKIHLVIDKDGRTNLPHVPKSTSKSLDWPMRHLAARDASLLVEDFRHNATLRLNRGR